MRELARSQVEGTFSGWNGGAIFKLVNGQVWQQSVHTYQYHYAYRPAVRLLTDGGPTYIEVEGMGGHVPVRRVSIAEEGTIVSDFTGFSGDAKFEFQNGRVWVPAEYKYSYHYAHRPEAVIVDGINGYEMMVEGMSETLRVRRA